MGSWTSPPKNVDATAQLKSPVQQSAGDSVGASNRVADGPGRAEVVLLALGLLAGVLLGPGVLGRWSPDTYERWFVGAVAERKAMKELEDQAADRQKRLEKIGATAAAWGELAPDAERRHKELIEQIDEARRDKLQAWAGRANAMVVAVVVITLLEAALGCVGRGRVAVLRGRLTAGRYAVLAAWVGLVAAQPELVHTVSWWFVALLVVGAAGAATVPMGRGRKPDNAG